MDIREQRLIADHKKIIDISNRSPYITILEKIGKPPFEYLVKFTSRGIEKLDENQNPILREDHRFRIKLGPEYPFGIPFVQCETPIFHPNISANGKVCIGNDWQGGGRYLDDLITFIAQMVRYEGIDLIISSDAFRIDGYLWAKRVFEEKPDIFPIDKRDLFSISGQRISHIGVNSTSTPTISVKRKRKL